MSEFLSAVVPPIGVLILFVVVIRALVLADRRERAARQKIDAEVERASATKPDDETSTDPR